MSDRSPRTFAALLTAPAARASRSVPFGAALCLAAYLYGSLPFVYLLGRRRHVDLKRVGSGNVGATNLLESAGAAGAVLGWIFDASKGLLPIVLARRLGVTKRVAELAGVCGVAGQCWPVFLRFNGGRGISAYVGASYAIERSAWGAALLPMIGGSLWRVVPRLRHKSGNREQQSRAVRSKSVPLGCFLSALIFPVVSTASTRHHSERSLAPVLLSGVILLRRLSAPQPDDTTDGPRVRVTALVYRLLYDRNTSS